MCQQFRISSVLVGHITAGYPHLPYLDKLAAGADSDHVPVIGHPDTVHVLVMILVTTSEPSSANLVIIKLGSLNNI